ncbi:MAG: hypothetical protein LBE13_10170, partial [Bacteroidales bacterium]|nr:hypothetical protein [Bacteroidales bacterium]
SEITETSLELALTLEDNVCYYLSGGDNGGGGSGGIGKISCTTKACSNTNGCLPNFWGTMCSSCDRGDCTKTVSSGVSATLTNAMQYAVDVYKSYGQN